MAKFLIELMLQHLEWYTLQKIVSIPLIIYIAYKLLVYAKEYVSTFQTSSIPGSKCNAPLFYLLTIISIYKRSTHDLPAMCLGLQTFVGLFQLYGKNGLFRFKLLFKEAVVFYEPDTVKAVLSNSDLIEKNEVYVLFRPFLGTGLITSPASKWQRDRKIVTPTFHLSILEDFTPVFQEQANVLISKIESRMQEPWIDIVPLMSLLTLDTICETAMGVSMDFQSGKNSDYLRAVHEIVGTIMYRVLRPWLYPDIIFYLTPLGKKFKANLRLVQGLNGKVLKQKINEPKYTKMSATDKHPEKSIIETKIRKPFLELLLEYHRKEPSFTEQDIREQVDTIMFGGHDTTASAMSWALYCLGIYPDVQREVHEELDAIFENETDQNITRAILAKMKYLECVIKETLRLYPTIPVIARGNQQPFKVLDHTVNQGTICFVHIFALHRDPVSFPNPEKFDPKRFFKENCVGRHPYAYIPFSAGPRNCIGQRFAMMEAKTVLATVLRQFKVVSLDPSDKVLYSINLVLENVHPLRLRFEPR